MGGGCRGYMAVVPVAYYEFKMDMCFNGGYRCYLPVVTAINPILDDVNMSNY